MNHYVYRITDLKNHKYYIGSRSCEIDPSDDLGVIYYSSSSDHIFKKRQIEFPSEFKYKIIRNFRKRESALNFEAKLHSKFMVARNQSFYNRAEQTTSKFSTYDVVSHNKNKTEYTFENIKSGEMFIGTLSDLKNKGVTNANRLMYDLNTANGWKITSDNAEKRNQPIKSRKTMKIIYEETRFSLIRIEDGAELVGTPKDLIEKTQTLKSKMFPIFTGVKKKYRGYCLRHTYETEIKTNNPDSDFYSIKDTKFLFKNFEGIEEYKTPRTMVEKYGVSLTGILGIISSKALSCEGWYMGWYIPYKEKLTGDHNKYNNKDICEYNIYDLSNRKWVRLTRDEIKKELPTASEASVSMFLSKKIKVLFDRFSHQECPTSTIDFKKYTICNQETGEILSGLRVELAKKTPLNKSDVHRLVSKRAKTSKGWVLMNAG